MKRLNGFSEVLRGFERFLITSEKLSVYLSEASENSFSLCIQLRGSA
jgi:hypothetical protein